LPKTFWLKLDSKYRELSVFFGQYFGESLNCGSEINLGLFNTFHPKNTFYLSPTSSTKGTAKGSGKGGEGSRIFDLPHPFFGKFVW
jgi:hypothetical protein